MVTVLWIILAIILIALFLAILIAIPLRIGQMQDKYRQTGDIVYVIVGTGLIVGGILWLFGLMAIIMWILFHIWKVV